MIPFEWKKSTSQADDVHLEKCEIYNQCANYFKEKYKIY